MANHTIGLDIGTHSIKVVHLENFRVTQALKVPYSEEALFSLRKTASINDHILVTSLSGIDVQVRSFEVPFYNPRKIETILKGLLQTQLHTSIDVDQLQTSWFLQTHKENTQPCILTAFAKKDSIRSYLTLLGGIEINPTILTPKAAAFYPLLQAQLQDAKLGVLIDLGHDNTCICVGDEKNLWLARSLFKTEISAVIREVHQTLSGLAEPVQQIYLVGGGALIPNIDTEFKKIFNIPAEVLMPLSLSPSLALATSCALIGQTLSEKRNRFNFRQNEFAFRSDFKINLTGPRRTYTIWGLILLGLLSLNYGTRYYLMNARLEYLKGQGQVLCERVADFDNCLGRIKTTLTQGVREKIPTSVIDTYMEVSKAFPAELPIKLMDLEMTPQKVRFSAESLDPSIVEPLISNFSKAPCFKNVTQRGIKQTQSGVQFQLQIDVDCENSL